MQQRLRLRVAALGTLLESALERDRLAAKVVETEALRRSDALKTALLRATSHDLRSTDHGDHGATGDAAAGRP